MCEKGNIRISIFEAYNRVVVRGLGGAVVEYEWSGTWAYLTPKGIMEELVRYNYTKKRVLEMYLVNYFGGHLQERRIPDLGIKPQKRPW